MVQVFLCPCPFQLVICVRVAPRCTIAKIATAIIATSKPVIIVIHGQIVTMQARGLPQERASFQLLLGLNNARVFQRVFPSERIFQFHLVHVRPFWGQPSLIRPRSLTVLLHQSLQTTRQRSSACSASNIILALLSLDFHCFEFPRHERVAGCQRLVLALVVKSHDVVDAGSSQVQSPPPPPCQFCSASLPSHL